MILDNDSAVISPPLALPTDTVILGTVAAGAAGFLLLSCANNCTAQASDKNKRAFFMCVYIDIVNNTIKRLQSSVYYTDGLLKKGAFQIFAAYISLTPAIPSPRSREGRKRCENLKCTLKELRAYRKAIFVNALAVKYHEGTINGSGLLSAPLLSLLRLRS